MTEFWALVERHKDKEARKFIRAGTVTAAIYNVNRDPKKHPQAVTANDIFPGIVGSPKEVRDATAAEIDMFFTGVVAEQAKKQPNGKVSLKPRRKVSRETMIDG